MIILLAGDSGTALSFFRWRVDKEPRQCTMDQVEHREGKSLELL
jgi:hypothetical protein